MHYIGAISPLATAVEDTFTISQLRQEDIAKQINSISTFFIPLRDFIGINAKVAEKIWGANAAYDVLEATPKWNQFRPAPEHAYGERELKMIAQLDNHVVPEDHKDLRASEAMRKFMIDPSFQPRLCEEYRINLVSVVVNAKGLSDLERFILKLGSQDAAFTIMKASKADMDSGREITKDELVDNLQSPHFKLQAVAIVIIAAV